MLTKELSGLARVIKARTIYRPEGEPTPSSEIVALRELCSTVLLPNPQQTRFEVMYGEPRRDDFGLITLDEAHQVMTSIKTGLRVGLHILRSQTFDFKSLISGYPSADFLFLTQRNADLDPFEHLLSRRPEWIHPEEWLAEQEQAPNAFLLPKKTISEGLSRLTQEKIRSQAAILGLL